jgi:P2 family phage contractile tail tube protein
MPTRPNIISDAVVYAGGELLTSVESVDLPDITLASEEVEQLGMAGAIEMPQPHTEAMTTTISFASYNPDDLSRFTPGEAVQLEVRSSISDVTEDGRSEFPRIITMRTLFMDRTNDTAERNRDEGPELELAVHYFKEELDGNVLHEIDQQNRVFKYEGEDLLEERNSNLGF